MCTHLVLRVLISTESDGVAGGCWAVCRVTPRHHNTRVTYHRHLQQRKRHCWCVSEGMGVECMDSHLYGEDVELYAGSHDVNEESVSRGGKACMQAKVA